MKSINIKKVTRVEVKLYIKYLRLTQKVAILCATLQNYFINIIFYLLNFKNKS